MQAVSPRFGLLSLHTSTKNSYVYLYSTESPGEVRLNHNPILQNSPEVVALEKMMAQEPLRANLVQQIQQPLIQVIQNLPISDRNKTRLVDMLSGLPKTRLHIQRSSEETPTHLRFCNPSQV